MTPPEAPVVGKIAVAADTPPAVSVCLGVLRIRADFVKASKAMRSANPAFVLQARQRNPEEAGEGIRVGFTCSKKVGNAVARNRAKRRLRAIARQILPKLGKPGWDYVLVGRAGTTATIPFDQLEAHLHKSLVIIHPESQ